MVICVRIIRCSYVFQHINISTQSFQQKILHNKTCLKHFLLETAQSNELVLKMPVAQLPIHLLYKVVMIDPFQGHVSNLTQRELFPFKSGCHTYFKIQHTIP